MDNLEKKSFFRRKGIVQIQYQSITRYPAYWREVLSLILIERAGLSLWNRNAFYAGYCEQFDEMAEGEETPFYVVKTGEGGTILFERLSERSAEFYLNDIFG